MSNWSDDLKLVLSRPGAIFVKGQSFSLGYTIGQRSEYLKAVVRQLLIGKLVLRESVEGSGAVFLVRKTSGKQRLVWHGRAVSECAQAPPHPRHQPTLACLVDLECSKQDPLYFSKRDATAYFDTCAAPHWIRGWFGMPSIRVAELLDFFDLDSLHQYLDGCSLSVLEKRTALHPVHTCWPMGFSWSSAIGQDNMLNITMRSGLTSDMLIADDKVSPLASSEIFAVCTDDLMHWARDREEGAKRMEVVDEEWRKAGLQCKIDKGVNQQLHGSAIGGEFDGEGFLGPQTNKQLQVLLNVMNFAQYGTAQPCAISSTLGVIQWFNLLVRPTLSVFGAVYDFVQMHGESKGTRPIPASVLSELLHSVALAAHWSADLSRPYLPLLSATDACTSYGFGVSVCQTSEAEIRYLARLAEKRGDYVKLASDGYDADAKQRIGMPHRLNLSKFHFTHLLSCKAQHAAHHVNVLECEAYLLWLRWLLRSTARHGVRAVCLLDSKVALGAISKGRSSSMALQRVLRQCAAVTLAGNVLIRHVYVPSGDNPADAPSRGLRNRMGRIRKKLKRPTRKHRCDRILERYLEASEIVSRLQDLDDSSSYSDASSDVPY